MPIIILKVGGSLLTESDLASQLPLWCDHLVAQASDSSAGTGDQDQIPPRLGLVVGGGTLVDVIRDWEPRHQLSAKTAHVLAISTLRVTAELVADLLKCPLISLPVVGPVASGTAEGGASGLVWPSFSGPVVIDLSAAAAADRELPASWDVTSDSLALWGARRLQAHRLVLLKAVNPLENLAEIGKIQNLGWIDVYFSRMLSEGGHPEIQVDIAHYFHRPRQSKLVR